MFHAKHGNSYILFKICASTRNEAKFDLPIQNPHFFEQSFYMMCPLILCFLRHSQSMYA